MVLGSGVVRSWYSIAKCAVQRVQSGLLDGDIVATVGAGVELRKLSSELLDSPTLLVIGFVAAWRSVAAIDSVLEHALRLLVRSRAGRAYVAATSLLGWATILAYRRRLMTDIAVVLRDDQSVFRRRLLLSSAPDISWYLQLVRNLRALPPLFWVGVAPSFWTGIHLAQWGTKTVIAALFRRAQGVVVGVLTVSLVAQLRLLSVEAVGDAGSDKPEVGEAQGNAALRRARSDSMDCPF
jgi:hypothetical protein